MRRALPLLLLAVLALPATARAGTGTVKTFTAGRSDVTFRYVVYTAKPGERNAVSVTLVRVGNDPLLVLDDAAGVTPGAGCAAAGTTQLRCPLVVDPAATADEQRASPQPIVASLGDRNDSFRLDLARGYAAVVNGGAGNDRLTGGRGGGSIDEETPGFEGNEITGGPGNDSLTGGSGSDLFLEGGPGPSGSDTIRGKGGIDEVSYEKRRAPVHADLSGDRDDGARGERDRIFPDVEYLVGGHGRDTLIGNGRGNALVGDLRSIQHDPLRSDFGLDGLAPDSDRSGDILRGGGGPDRIIGSAGPDRVNGGPGFDRIRTGGGNDVIDADDNARDRISCGPGLDRALVDKPDIFGRDCERVSR